MIVLVLNHKNFIFYLKKSNKCTISLCFLSSRSRYGLLFFSNRSGSKGSKTCGLGTVVPYFCIELSDEAGDYIAYFFLFWKLRPRIKNNWNGIKTTLLFFFSTLETILNDKRLGPSLKQARNHGTVQKRGANSDGRTEGRDDGT